MRLDLYQAETERIAAQQAAVLEEARRILANRPLTPLENNGLLHALQILIENAIGKAKQWLKASGQVVPISAYDAFSALANTGLIDPRDLKTWNILIGIRNRIVHDYMNIDLERIHTLIREGGERFVTEFLLRRIGEPPPQAGQ